MRKNEKEGLLYLRRQVEDLARTADLSSKDYENYTLSELDYFNAQHNAYVSVLALLDLLFFKK